MPCTLTAAANVEVPAYLVLVAKGYRADVDRRGGTEEWVAEKDDTRLIAGSPLELLGLSCVLEARGATWQPTDDEIDAFLERFYGGAT